jgi:Excalibur calcium-binding domain
MARSLRIGSTLAAAAVLTVSALTVLPADAHTTGIHDNCTQFNRRFPHGVGTRHAHDRTSGTPVTNFRRSNRIYWRAERHNSDLDRDNDRIACEKA